MAGGVGPCLLLVHGGVGCSLPFMAHLPFVHGGVGPSSLFISGSVGPCSPLQYFTLPGLFHMESMEWRVDSMKWLMDSMEWLIDSMEFPNHSIPF